MDHVILAWSRFASFIGAGDAEGRWLRWVGAAVRRGLPSRSIDLLLDERDPKDPLCAQKIVRTTVKSEKSLVVAAMQSKGPLVLNLESGSRATPGSVQSLEFTLVVSPLVDALANL